MALIRIQGVEVRYNSIKALDNVSMDVSEGEVVAVLGPNGSGKTTLLKVIDGILKPVKGSVYIDSKSVLRMSRRDVAKLVGFVPQRVNVMHGVKVIDFVVTGRKPHVDFAPTARDIGIALKYLKYVDAEHLAERDITELSGGEFQRILIARALAAEPRILLLDEPTANLDMKYQLAILDIIARLSKEKRLTVVMTLHDLTQAYRYAEKAVFLNNSRVYAMGRVEEVMSEEVIEAVYGVKVKVIPSLRAVIAVS
uniref:ABC transporter ATP-binding protein n=1 Tax=Ignisphaera aggregans TaxID=334771 RepID=A0A7C4BBC3_9CREN